MIVDDNDMIRRLVSITFEDGNYSILEAENGAKALELVAKEKPDVIFLDVMMPGEFNGLDVCKKIKASPDHKNCCIVLLTARAQKKDIEDGLKAGADFYLSKPFLPSELVEIVERRCP